MTKNYFGFFVLFFVLLLEESESILLLMLLSLINIYLVLIRRELRCFLEKINVSFLPNTKENIFST
jgi:hypothetical protein